MLSTIRLNNTGDLVKVAQYLTKYVEINDATGIFDDKFEAYVTAYQSNHGLEADGIIGKNTWTTIADEALTCSTSKNKTSVYTCAIQILLGGLEVDGIYGSKTKKAVAAYQTSAQLDADGICGSKTWKKLITGVSSSSTPAGSGETSPGQTISDDKVLNNCVKYLQWDGKWKNVKFSTHTSSQTIGNSGCGPTSMAMIMATWINSKITPVEMCALAVDNGYRTYNSGTAWGFFKYVFKHYDGFEKYVETGSVETLKAALREGALAVCSMNSNDNGFWTSGGHYITARGCDDTYIYANDPNKSETPRKQTAAKFQKCMKQAFIFWPKKKLIEPEPVKEIPSKTDFKLDGKIIDISKWQGTIDFDKLQNEVSLVIARASCGSDKDVKIDEYAKAMNERGIPFGVYCYSYAGDEAKAIDEAQKIVKYVSQYNPLFYVMDAEESKITNASIKAFAAELRKQGAKKIGCYVAHNHYKDYNYASIQNLFDFTWIPRYGKNLGTIESSMKPAYFCDLWQYTSTGKIAGISGNVDINIITGDGHDLIWFLNE